LFANQKNKKNVAFRFVSFSFSFGYEENTFDNHNILTQENFLNFSAQRLQKIGKVYFCSKKLGFLQHVVLYMQKAVLRTLPEAFIEKPEKFIFKL